MTSLVSRSSFVSEAEIAAVAFLSRYSGRTLESYRHDLRTFFQWTADVGINALDATRAHIELYRNSLEDRRLAAATIDRRLSTVCGFFRFAHIDGRITANPAQYVRRPTVYPNDSAGMDRAALGAFLFTAERHDRAHAALAVLLGLNGLRVSEACATNIEDLAFERGHRTLRIIGKGKQACRHPVGPSHRTHDRSRGRRTPRRPDPASPRRTTPRPTDRAPVGTRNRTTRRPGNRAPAHAPRRVHHGRTRRRRAAT